ncbi:PKD domain-containing protein [Leeuwenhoekiella nanhaiensis]|uniref:Uncharacterized protein n=1 Tax=Leeuwenhoekiella nanhaiensis TaxID=1655491 RepID=A0A2G1VM57_9FLAO|nr:hypothetical protein [Leeuwenhoekiella nanhaiensis]PHQ27855.1 hypothetical protein CJ305_17780 [Leeuwenhoekiella nanhaiensis]
MEILKLDGYIVDLEPKKVAQTLQINDLAEVQNRQANYTNRFTLPPTPKNVQVMDYLGISGNQSLKPYQRIPAKLIVDGIELISKGYAQINESGKGYDVVVYDGNINLYEALKGRRLDQLNYSDLNHFLSESVYTGSFENTEGYIYGLADFGVKKPFSLIRIDYQAPSLFLHTVWDKIFTDLGFTYEGDIFESNDFKTELIGPANGYEVSNESIVTEDLATMESLNVIDRNAATNGPQSFTDSFNFGFTNVNGDKINIFSNAEATMRFNGRIKIDIGYTLQLNAGNAYINIYKNDKAVKTIYGTTGSSYEPATLFLEVKDLDTISAKLISATQPDIEEYGPDTENAIWYLDVTSTLKMELSEQIGGQFIDFATLMPATSQIDFVKDVMQRYGLMYTQDRNSNNFKFIRFEKLLNDRVNAEDWSNMLVDTGTEQYSFGDYARSNKMAYTYEKDVLNLDYDGELIVNNELLNSEKTLFTSIFKIRQASLFRSSEPVYLLPIWEEVEDDGVLIIQPAKTELSLFRLFKKQLSTSYQLFDNGAIETFTGELPILSQDNIQFQYYINNYYKAFGRLLEWPKKRISIFNLSLIDIYNIDFLRLKYIKQLGQYYYLNKVNNYQNGKTTSCELIQVVGTSRNSPPTQLGTYSTFIGHGSSFNPSLIFFTERTTPKYFDPEYDQPEMIKILGGFAPNVQVLLDGVEQTEEFEFDANNYALSFIDLENDKEAHSFTFPFKIKSFNSDQYSDVTGELRINVRAKVLIAPSADAGPDTTYTYDQLDTTPDPDKKSFILDGTGSTDNETITTYAWTLISQPSGSDITIFNANLQSAYVEVLDNGSQYGAYTFELTVTDNDDLTDTDQVTITINPV